MANNAAVMAVVLLVIGFVVIGRASKGSQTALGDQALEEARARYARLIHAGQLRGVRGRVREASSIGRGQRR